MKRYAKSCFTVVFGLFGYCHSPAYAAPVELQAITNIDTAREKASMAVGDRPAMVWTCNGKAEFITFKASAPVVAPAGGVIYLKVVYVDQGFGRLRVQLSGNDGNFIGPDRFLGLARGNTEGIAMP